MNIAPIRIPQVSKQHSGVGIKNSNLSQDISFKGNLLNAMNTMSLANKAQISFCGGEKEHSERFNELKGKDPKDICNYFIEHFEDPMEMSPDEQLELLKQIYYDDNNTIAHILAIRNPDVYLKVAKSFEDDKRLDLLKMTDSYGISTAHKLGYFYPKATEGFTPEQRFDLLILADNRDNTVAHKLANFIEPGTYLKATEGFTPEQRFKLLAKTNWCGKTVAHNLAYRNPDVYLEITKDCTPDQQLELLNMTARDSGGFSVAENLSFSKRQDIYETLKARLGDDISKMHYTLSPEFWDIT